MSSTFSVRPFFTKTGLMPAATASAYIETNDPTTGQATKLSCSLFGPMQLQAQGGANSLDQCQIKVNIEFTDERKAALLDQMPVLAESLEAVSANMPTEAVA